MAAPKGNQYAVGNQGGRPPKYDLDKEAQDLLDFSATDACTSLERFTFHKEYTVDQLTDFCKRSEVFTLALKKAKERIGIRREEMVSKNEMNYGVWNRSARLYSIPVKDDEEDVKNCEYERKKQLIEWEYKIKGDQDVQYNSTLLNNFNDLMTQISGLQSKDLNKDSTKIKEDNKS